MNKFSWWALPLILLMNPHTAVGQSLTQEACEADGQFRWIPEGPFLSGSDQRERDYAYALSAQAAAPEPSRIPTVEQQLRQQGWFDQEHPPQQLALPSFCIAHTPVTNAEYQRFLQSTGHPPPGISASDYQQQGFLVHPYETVKRFLWQGLKYPTGTAEHPVVLVSSEDALAYARWRGEQDGYTYLLPSEGQWEKAARGSNGRYFPWGSTWQDEATNWGGSGRDFTAPVTAYSLSRSPFGVEDMAGNVFEYTSTLEKAGQVLKGCSWDDLPGFCRAAYRHTRPLGSRHILFGFRLVKRS